MFADPSLNCIKVVDFGISGSNSKINIEYTNAGSIR